MFLLCICGIIVLFFTADTQIVLDVSSDNIAEGETFQVCLSLTMQSAREVEVVFTITETPPTSKNRKSE